METTCNVCELLPASFVCTCLGNVTYTCPGCISIHMMHSPSIKHELQNLSIPLVPNPSVVSAPSYDKELLIHTCNQLNSIKQHIIHLHYNYSAIQSLFQGNLNRIDSALENLNLHASEIDRLLSCQNETSDEKLIQKLLEERKEVLSKYSEIFIDSKKQFLSSLSQLITQAYVEYADVNTLTLNQNELQDQSQPKDTLSDLLLPGFLELDSKPKDSENISFIESKLPKAEILTEEASIKSSQTKAETLQEEASLKSTQDLPETLSEETCLKSTQIALPSAETLLEVTSPNSIEGSVPSSDLLEPEVVQPKTPPVINSHSVISLRSNTRKLFAYDYVKNSHRSYTMEISGNFPEYIAGCKISDELLLFTGGFDGENYLNTSFLINLTNLRIKFASSMNQSRAGHAMICFNSKIYTFGGSAFKILSSAERYDIQSNTWEELPSMTYPRAAFTACIFLNKIILAGGLISNTIEVFDPISYEYTVLKYTLPYSDSAAICTASDCNIYILQNDKLILLNQQLELDCDKYIEMGSIGGWTQMPPIRDERTFIYELEDTNTVYQIHQNLKEVHMIYGY